MPSTINANDSRVPTRIDHKAALSKPAHAVTEDQQRRVASQLNFEDTSDFDDASRGLIGSIENAAIYGAAGNLVWSMGGYGFLEEAEGAPSVNPSLWRMARLNTEHGLFRVTDRIFQVRGFDVANVTFIETDNGLLVIDPLSFEESASAALALYRKHRGDRVVVAVVYTHSHHDHYGGAGGVVDERDVVAGRVKVIAPDKFMEEVASEAVLAGAPMRRRSQFQIGKSLEPGVFGHVDSGIGKGMGQGTSGLIPPTVVITQPRQRMNIDGLEIEFQLTPGAEAPADMNIYFPGLRALGMAENACHTMHNLCPIRGAKSRDALAWSKYIDQALEEYAENVDVMFTQHHWPVWGTQRLVEYLADQRDLYRFLHDQTLRLMSHGMTALEIAEELMLPNELSRKWHVRGYYGAMVQNVRAIYAHYLGPYDGHPVNLNPLPPVPAAVKYFEYMGGVDATIQKALVDFAAGEFRWVAQVMCQAVFADPTNQTARQLAADALEQLGYQAESAAWRNSYLLAARELRQGKPTGALTGNTVRPEVIAKLGMEHFLDYLAVRVNGPGLSGMKAAIDWVMTDEGTSHRLTLSNGALSHRGGSHGNKAMATIRTDRQKLVAALQGAKSLLGALSDGSISVDGDRTLVHDFFAGLDQFDPAFAVVEP